MGSLDKFRTDEIQIRPGRHALWTDFVQMDRPDCSRFVQTKMADFFTNFFSSSSTKPSSYRRTALKKISFLKGFTMALQRRLEEEVMSKKFLLVLDDIWEEDEEKDKSKWEDVLVPLASGGFGSKIMVTTRTDSVALMFAKVIKKKKEIVKLEGLGEDECLQLLNSHAFAGVENPPDDHENLRVIARDIVKKLSGSPLEARSLVVF